MVLVNQVSLKFANHKKLKLAGYRYFFVVVPGTCHCSTKKNFESFEIPVFWVHFIYIRIMVTYTSLGGSQGVWFLIFRPNNFKIFVIYFCQQGSIQWTLGSQIYLSSKKIIFGQKWFLNKEIKTRQSMQWSPWYTF